MTPRPVSPIGHVIRTPFQLHIVELESILAQLEDRIASVLDPEERALFLKVEEGLSWLYSNAKARGDQPARRYNRPA